MDEQFATPPTLRPAGWYPTANGRLRWWDGRAWGQFDAAGPTNGVRMSPTPVARTNPLGAIVLAVGIFALLICLIPFGVVVGGPVALAAATLGIYAANRRAPRTLAFVGAAVGGLALILGISITAAVAAPTPQAAPRHTSSFSPRPSFTANAPSDPAAAKGANTAPSVAVEGDIDTNKTALALLAQLPIKPAKVGGYQRSTDFGDAWIDVDRNGCDTRNDILARDLTNPTRSGPCKVLTGALVSPYTGAILVFQRGENTSALVQMDHLVSLEDAWQTGAQALTYSQRLTLANDPLELLAVDGKSNNEKSASDASEWLPPDARFACAYVARQISVKITYGLWVTQAEHDAMARVLTTCPTVSGTASQFAPAPPETVTPSEPAPSIAHQATAAPAPPAAVTVVHPGAYCSVAGARGVTATGTTMVCDITATDSRLRWRSR